MTAHRLRLAVAALATGIAAPAHAVALGPSPGLVRAVLPETNSVWHPIVWQCAWKQVCLKWGNHHNCERWGQKKVCNPAVQGSNAPPSTPPKIKKRL